MLRKVSIAWYKQRSGNFALKGITINEDNRSYDSNATFRDEDAEWLTGVLKAQPDVEVVQVMGNGWNTGYPSWASNKGETSTVEEVTPIATERANTVLLRHFLSHMLEASGDTSEDGVARFRKLVHDASSFLRSTDCGTYYTVDEAIALLTKKDKKPKGVG